MVDLASVLVLHVFLQKLFLPIAEAETDSKGDRERKKERGEARECLGQNTFHVKPIKS